MNGVEGCALASDKVQTAFNAMGAMKGYIEQVAGLCDQIKEQSLGDASRILMSVKEQIGSNTAGDLAAMAVAVGKQMDQVRQIALTSVDKIQNSQGAANQLHSDIKALQATLAK